MDADDAGQRALVSTGRLPDAQRVAQVLSRTLGLDLLASTARE